MVSYTTPSPLNAEHSHGPNPYNAAKSFTESDLTLWATGIRVSSGSLKLDPPVFVDDFEDNDITIAQSNWSGWSGNTGSLTSQSTTVLKGSYTGRLRANDTGLKIHAIRNTRFTDEVEVLLQASQDTGNSSNSNQWGIRVRDAGTIVSKLSFLDGVNDVELNGTQIRSSWSADKEYRIRVIQDFNNNETEVIINGTRYGPEPFLSSASGTDEVTIRNNTYNSGVTRDVFIDSQPLGSKNSSGRATIEWPYPSDIYEWDVATFTRTLDGETVDVYVAYNDGTGWTRTNGGNPIKRNYSLANDSNISASDDVRIEADLSRTNTANNPTLDSAYRTWRL